MPKPVARDRLSGFYIYERRDWAGASASSMLTLMGERLKCNNFSETDTRVLCTHKGSTWTTRTPGKWGFTFVSIFCCSALLGKMLLDESSVPVAFVNRKRIWQSLSNKFFDVFALTTPPGTSWVSRMSYFIYATARRRPSRTQLNHKLGSMPSSTITNVSRPKKRTYKIRSIHLYPLAGS